MTLAQMMPLSLPYSLPLAPSPTLPSIGPQSPNRRYIQASGLRKLRENSRRGNTLPLRYSFVFSLSFFSVPLSIVVRVTSNRYASGMMYYFVAALSILVFSRVPIGPGLFFRNKEITTSDKSNSSVKTRVKSYCTRDLKDSDLQIHIRVTVSSRRGWFQ